MFNQEIAKIFYNIASYYEIEGVVFKPQAYEKAAVNLENLEEDASDIYKKEGLGGLRRIPGVGEGIAKKIEEYIKTGKIKEYENFQRKLPINLGELTAVEGLGVRKAKVLYEKLGVKNLKDLEKAAKERKIAPLFGFGEKTEKNILEGIEFLKRSAGRFPLGEILPKVKAIENALKNLKEVKRVEVCGSVRRKKETIGDVDFLVISNQPQRVMDFFVSLPGVVKVLGKGATKTSMRFEEGYDMDIRVVPEKSYGAALQYFTGSKEHNIVLRKIAMDKGLKLSEYGLFRGAEMIAGEKEEEIYEKLGLQWIPPEMRENQGEIEVALRQAQGKLNGLPKLIELKDIKGDLHCHSHWGSGNGPEMIERLLKAAVDRGYEYIGISDHTKFLAIEHGIDEKQLAEQGKYIDKLNKKIQVSGFKFHVLRGCESNILPDGSIDVSNEALSKLDYVIAGVHSSFKMPKAKMTERIIKAMKNPHVDIISHPTGRIIGRRPEYEIDIDKILRAAKETGTILEINAHPARLDLNDINIRKAKSAGVKMIINADAHQAEETRLIDYGVSQARRGWAGKGDIINTKSVFELLNFFKLI